MSKWISVKDRLPKDGYQVLALAEDGLVLARYWSMDEAWDEASIYSSGVIGQPVTHWMFLPELPK